MLHSTARGVLNSPSAAYEWVVLSYLSDALVAVRSSAGLAAQ